MRARGLGVHFRLCLDAVLVSRLDQQVQVLRRGELVLGQVLDVDGPVFDVFAYLETGVRRVQKVVDVFVVYLEETGPERVVYVRVAVEVAEYVLDCLRNHTVELVVHDGVSLPASGLAVRQDAAVVPIQEVVDDGLARALVYVFLRRALAEYLVKRETVRLEQTRIVLRLVHGLSELDCVLVTLYYGNFAV